MFTNKNLIFLSIVLAVAVSIFLFVIFSPLNQKNKNPGATKTIVNTAPALVVEGKPIFLPKNTLPQNFPSNLLLNNSAVVDSAFTIPYGKTEQSTVAYFSGEPIKDLFGQYLKFFGSNNYQVLNNFVKNDFAQIYAVSKNGDVNLNISGDAGGKLKVVINFLRK